MVPGTTVVDSKAQAPVPGTTIVDPKAQAPAVSKFVMSPGDRFGNYKYFTDKLIKNKSKCTINSISLVILVISYSVLDALNYHTNTGTYNTDTNCSFLIIFLSKRKCLYFEIAQVINEV